MRKGVIVWTSVLIVVVAGLGWYGYSWWQHKTGGSGAYNYIIPGVPLMDMYQSVTLADDIQSPFRAGLLAILEYWGDTHASASSTPYEFLTNGVVNVDQVTAFLNSQGFTMQAVDLLTTDDLKQYINPSHPVPLLFAQPFSLDHLDISEYQVLVGLDLKDGQIVSNSFTRGPLYRVSLADFQHLWDVTDMSLRYRYFVIEPKDAAQAAQAIAHNQPAPPYPARTSVMGNPSLLYGFLYAVETPPDPTWAAAVAHLLSSPTIGELHPLWRIRLYQMLVKSALFAQKFPQALAGLGAAQALNHNLNDPLPGWGSPGYSESPYVFGLFAQYYVSIGDKKDAASAIAQYHAVSQAQFGTSTPRLLSGE
jgi:hypothetical protein